MSDEEKQANPIIQAEPKKPAPKAKRAKPEKLNLDALAKVSPEDAAYETRKALVKMPDGLEGDSAQEWAEGAIKKLVPEAVASLAYDLRFGTDKQRSEAADKVLRSVGMDKREATQQGSQALIVLNLGSEAVSNVPWLQRVQKPPKSE